MKQFNQQLHDDIALLRTLHAKKDKHGFNVLKAEIMKNHNISKATVYREMKKDTPGEYKVPNYNPPKMDIRMPEILMVRELLLSGRQATEIIKIMSKELDIKYHWDRFNAVRKLAEELPEDEYDPKQTAFAGGGRKFFTELFNLEYMAPSNYDVFPVNGEMIKISRENYDLIVLIVMDDNPPDGEDITMKKIREEVLAHELQKKNTMRAIKALTKSGEPGSAYALKSLNETYEKLLAKDKRIEEKKKYLLHHAKTCMVDGFYTPENLNNPTDYEPDEVLEALKKDPQDLENSNGKAKNDKPPTLRTIKNIMLREAYEDFINRQNGIKNADSFEPDEEYLMAERALLESTGLIEKESDNEEKAGNDETAAGEEEKSNDEENITR